MALPRREIDIQTAVPHLVPIPFVDITGQPIVEAPLPGPQFVPGQLHTSLGGRLPVIHDDERALIVLHPAPGEDVLAALVVGPPAALAEAPLAVPEEITMGHVQKASVEGSEIMINRLCWASAEEDRQPHPPSLELSLVQEPGSGESENRHRRRATSSVGKGGRGPGLVMVLDEPDHAFLVRKVRQEMLPHALGGPVLHPVVEFLVVAEVETLLLQLPLQIPIRLGDEPELRMPVP